MGLDLGSNERNDSNGYWAEVHIVRRGQPKCGLFILFTFRVIFQTKRIVSDLRYLLHNSLFRWTRIDKRISSRYFAYVQLCLSRYNVFQHPAVFQRKSFVRDNTANPFSKSD